NHNYVRSLAERRAQCRRKIGRISTDFDLLYDASNVSMFVLNWIFDDDNVARFTMIDFIDERSHGRGLAGTSRAAKQHKSAAKPRQILHRSGQMEFSQKRNLRGQRANRGR